MKELEEIGRRIRSQRIAVGLKQQELAGRSAVSPDTLSALENGRPVTTETLARVLKGLGSPDALENLLPPPAVSPVDIRKMSGRQRRRVR